MNLKGMVSNRESARPLALVIGGLALTGLAITWVSAPLSALLGDSRYALEAALHGVLAGLFMVTVTIGLFQAYRLLTGTIRPSWNLAAWSMPSWPS